MNKDAEFKQILEENKDRIYRICCAYVSDADDRNDLYQEILINIWKNLSKFEGRSQISTWIYRIAVNTSLLHIRNNGKRDKLHTEINENIHNIPEDNDKEEKIKTGSMITKLYESIRLLPDLDRLIISMVLDDLSYKEIAEITGINISNVGVKINRIKKSLNRIMGADENGN